MATKQFTLCGDLIVCSQHTPKSTTVLTCTQVPSGENEFIYPELPGVSNVLRSRDQDVLVGLTHASNQPFGRRFLVAAVNLGSRQVRMMTPHCATILDIGKSALNLVSVSVDGVVHVSDFATSTLLATIDLGFRVLGRAAYFFDRHALVVDQYTGIGQRLLVCDTATQTKTPTFVCDVMRPISAVHCVNDETLFVGTAQGMVCIYSLSRQCKVGKEFASKIKSEQEPFGYTITSIRSLHEQGNKMTLAIGDDNGTVFLWALDLNARQVKRLSALRHENSFVNSMNVFGAHLCITYGVKTARPNVNSTTAMVFIIPEDSDAKQEVDPHTNLAKRQRHEPMFTSSATQSAQNMMFNEKWFATIDDTKWCASPWHV